MPNIYSNKNERQSHCSLKPTLRFCAGSIINHTAPQEKRNCWVLMMAHTLFMRNHRFMLVNKFNSILRNPSAAPGSHCGTQAWDSSKTPTMLGPTTQFPYLPLARTRISCYHIRPYTLSSMPPENSGKEKLPLSTLFTAIILFIILK